MNFERLRQLLLQKAIEGKLVPQLDEEPPVEQIGEAPKDVPFAIPEKWKWVKLSSVGKIVGGGTPKTAIAEYWGGKVPWITPADLGKNKSKRISVGAKSITELGLNESSAKLMPKDSIVYSSRAPIGYVAIADNSLCTNQGCKSLVPDVSRIDAEFAYFCLISRTDDIKARASGTTFKEISGREMGETAVPLPPLAEQRRIVERLNDLLATLKKAEDAYKDLQVLGNNLRAKVLQQAIEGKLVPQLDEEPPVEQIGEAPKDVPFAIPEKWKWVHFSAVAELLNGRAYKKEELLRYKTGYTPIIRVGNFFTNSKWYYSNLQLDSNKYCDNGDLLFAWSASFGPKIWNGGRAIYHYHIWKVVITKYIDKNWLYWWLSCKSDSLKKSGHGSTMIHVTKNGMEHELLALPPIEEQRRIVEKLNALLPLVDQMSA